MIIKEIICQHRRDFRAIMKCEFCNNEENLNSGYDDDYYHQSVIPNMKCKKCNKSTISEGAKIKQTQTKYPSWMEV